ncbi:hypothetical protein LOK49_LG13G02106 [Camellia lanceoleosa]|uniref:Uncharacterized protein n=1 Tax=Camellia lanceoleosa TaxID=1840588 RepID=A0ACC0FME4_9ERIC|nr:hypothetical protein LOK49_LG13G02106 [Camellia lanceoleosa]
MIGHRSMLRFSGRPGLFDRAIRVFSPRSETPFNTLSHRSLFQIPQIDGVPGLGDLKCRSYIHSDVSAAANHNVVPQILGASFRHFIHSSSHKEFETARNSRSMNFVRGIIEEEGKGVMGSSQLSRYVIENNADIVHIKLLRNNTFVTVTDSKGNKKIGASSGCLSEMKGGPKLSRYAAEATAEHVGRLARNLGLKSVVMKVNGFTYFKKKKQAIVSFREGFTFSRGDQNPIVYIEDTTRKPHNGCRLRKRRRV